MDDHPRQILKEIILRYGHGVTSDPRRLKGLLKDLSPHHSRENLALLLALEQGMVRELLNNNGTVPASLRLFRLRDRLVDLTPLSKEVAQWVAESWAEALGQLDEPVVEQEEDSELPARKAELEAISAVLADKELELEELQQSIARFQQRYYAVLGARYRRLDELRAQLAERRAEHQPRDSDLQDQAQAAREAADQTAREYDRGASEPEPPPQKNEVPDSVKKLYRKIAAAIHPDKATDERSRRTRTRLMAELNEACALRDTDRMNAILAEWEAHPDEVAGDDAAAELVRTLRAIAQVERRIAAIEQERSDLLASDMYQFMGSAHQAGLDGRDLLQEMAQAVDEEIRQVEAELKEMEG